MKNYVIKSMININIFLNIQDLERDFYVKRIFLLRSLGELNFIYIYYVKRIANTIQIS